MGGTICRLLQYCIYGRKEKISYKIVEKWSFSVCASPVCYGPPITENVMILHSKSLYDMESEDANNMHSLSYGGGGGVRVQTEKDLKILVSN